MEALILYLTKMIVCSTILFGYYHLALRNRTFHHYNRFYLLSAVLVSILLPLLKVSYFTIEVNSDIYRLLTKINSSNTPQTTNNDFIYHKLIIIAFGLVSVFILGRFFNGILKIRTFRKQFPKEEVEGISFYQTNLDNAPFSFFKNLFWKNSILLNSDLGRQILKHEMVHIEQNHTHDKIFMEIVAGIFWFNPVFWFIKKEINLIHEYLADKKAVKHMDTKAFAQMLLASHFSGTVIPATSPFLSSNLKKRLKMLQKPKTKFGYAHRILALPLVFTLVFVYAVNAKNKEIEKTNKVIEAQLKEIKKDTIKKTVNATLVEVTSGNRPDFIEAKNASEQALFIIGAKEVSKSQYLDFIEKNKFNRDMVTSYMIDSPDNTSESLFGERGKLGVYRAQLFSTAPNERTDYHKLIEKYNPAWFNNPKFKKEVERSEIAMDGADSILQLGESSEKHILEAEKAKKEAAKAVADAKMAVIEAEKAEKAKAAAANESKLAQKEAAKAALEAKHKAEKVMIYRATWKKEVEESSKESALSKNNYKALEDEKKQAEKEFEIQRNAPWIISKMTNETPIKADNIVSKVSYSSKVTFTPSEPSSINFKNATDAKIFIDGLQANTSELNKIDPKNIKSITIYKKGTLGQTDQEMHVETKKLLKISE